MFYFWNSLAKHKAHINTKTHKHKTTISKKVVEAYLQEKCIQILSYNDNYNFLNVYSSGLFFVRITGITEKKERVKEGKLKAKEKRKLEKERRKKKKHGKRAKKTNDSKEKDEEEEETEIYERWDENEESENEFEEEKMSRKKMKRMT